MTQRTNRSLTVFLLLALGVGLGVALALTAPEPQAKQHIEWLQNPRALEEFSLRAEDSEFNRAALNGHWTIVMFGFLHCPDSCPTNLALMAGLKRSLGERIGSQRLRYVFVSIDPGRDSVSHVQGYVSHFDSSLVGVTGDVAQLSQFARDLGVQFSVPSTDDVDDYTLAHSVTFSIIDADGIFRGRFRPGFDVPMLADELARRLANRGV